MYNKEAILTIYKDYMNDEIDELPDEIFKNKEYYSIVMKYLIEDKYKFSSDKEIIKNYSKKFLIENKIEKLLTNYSKNKLFNLINTVYPNRFKLWEVGAVPKGFWKDDKNKIEAIKHLIEVRLKLSDYELLNDLQDKHFDEYGLGSLYLVEFKRSKNAVIKLAYPNRFYDWEFKMTPIEIWEDENNRRKAIKWMVEEKLKLSDDELKETLSKDMFKECKLTILLRKYFSCNPVRAIMFAYPNKFKAWEFNTIPKYYWYDDNNCIEAIKWLIEVKLKLKKEDVYKKLNFKLFAENGLGCMVMTRFNSSPFKAINFAYPNQYNPWMFKTVPKNYWKEDDNCKKAIIWLVEEKLNLKPEEAYEKISMAHFKKHSLNGLLSQRFNGSCKSAIIFSYPTIYSVKKIEHKPKGYCSSKDKCVKATKWLIEEKLKLTDDELKEKFCGKLFLENGLGGLITHGVIKKPWELLEATYPNKYNFDEFKNWKYVKYKNK